MNEPVNGTVALLERHAEEVRPTPPTPRRSQSIGRAAIGFVAGAIPTVLVLALAGGVGWWGHHSGWKLPKFSELTGRVTPKDDWCGEHSVPESTCVECNPDLMPRAEQRGWCKLHGVPECTLCNPELAQLPQTPVVSPADLDRAKRSLDFATRPANNKLCRSHHRRIQFTDAEAADKAGVEVEPVWTAPALEFVAAPGEVGYDQTRVAHLSSRAPGSVWKVFKHLGDPVQAGDVLALIDAAEVGKAKAELLSAYALLQLKTQTVASVRSAGGAIPEARIREADAAAREAEIRVGAGCQSLTNLGLPLEEAEVRTLSVEQLKVKLHLLGMPAAVAGKLDAKRVTSNLLPLVAPMDGVITSREVVAGEVVDPSRILFELVDPSRLWLTIDVKGEDARKLRVGLPVRFAPDAGGEELAGKLAWVSTQADPKTRTVKARADLADPEGRHRANTFGSGKVILREEPNAVSVPNEAVQWEGCCHVVFVRDKDYLKEGSPKVFHVRKVRLGAKDDKHTEVVAGVLPGELVATKASGLLLTELQRADLGEGCACCHPK
jgi:cobalt-zinc-cadmium efflux system membrane fusion protein